MRVDVSAEAGEFVRGRGGRLRVWAARPLAAGQATPGRFLTGSGLSEVARGLLNLPRH